MKPEDLCLVNEEGIVVEPGNMHAVNPAGFAIHVAVHKARPDVMSAVHCHSNPTKAFSALGCKLEPINQDACRYVDKCLAKLNEADTEPGSMRTTQSTTPSAALSLHTKKVVGSPRLSETRRLSSCRTTAS